MRVRVEEDVCQGHTLCAMNAPELFDLREDDGHAVVLLVDVPAELEAKARLAHRGCPEHAVVLEE
ncbi:MULTISPECIES: ferredoxin [unclassified Pseudofrankia]|uniref:ferredoxin n=1 Tax=unclassified Pseudofrankia TaxID=2994372 RepID=UPI0008DA73C0|nr:MULTISPECIES: ferredoxin [unclassified Pseudofrankia]MDT3441892.1 ferredoxin [Pseudofrankia sp. BMG5.37]OHV44532.1 ferredoxin [Pseudofrankia sp. BMG5.36]